MRCLNFAARTECKSNRIAPTLPIGTLVGEGIVDSSDLELSSIHSGVSIAVLLEYKIGGVQNTRRWGGGRKEKRVASTSTH